MKQVRKCKVSDVSLTDGLLTFTVHYTGSLKDQEVHTNWNVDNIDLKVVYRVQAEPALAGFGSSEWIALQGKLRKVGKDFCDQITGQTYTAASLDALIEGSLPKVDREAVKTENVKLWNLLRSKGFTDEEIRAQLVA